MSRVCLLTEAQFAAAGAKSDHSMHEHVSRKVGAELIARGGWRRIDDTMLVTSSEPTHVVRKASEVKFAWRRRRSGGGPVTLQAERSYG